MAAQQGGSEEHGAKRIGAACVCASSVFKPRRGRLHAPLEPAKIASFLICGTLRHENKPYAYPAALDIGETRPEDFYHPTCWKIVTRYSAEV